MRVLIVKTSSLGDVVQTFPVVEYLKRRQGAQRIGWVVERKAAPLVRAHPGVDTVLEIDTSRFRSFRPSFELVREFSEQKKRLQKESWDVVFDLQANCKSAVATLCANAPVKVGYGRRSAAESPNIIATTRRFDPPPGLAIRDEYLCIVRQFFNDPEPFEAQPIELRLSEAQQQALALERQRWPALGPVWFIAPGSRWLNKMCQPASLVELLHCIAHTYAPYFVFVAGGREELRDVELLVREFSTSSHILFHPDLPLLQRAMAAAQGVLAVDSIILHLAATTKTPTFGLFGPSRAAIYAPRGRLHGLFQGDCPSGVFTGKRCAQLRTCKKGACLKAAGALDIFSSLQAWQERCLAEKAK